MPVPTAESRLTLGKTNIQISPMGIGTWAWGDRGMWGFGKGYDESDVEDAFEVSYQAGINFYDTAEVYGLGKSEKILSGLIADKDVVLATKFFPFPWRWFSSGLQRAIRHSLQRLQLERIDLYQIHWPLPPRSTNYWVKAAAEAQEKGLTQAVGVSNYNLEQTRQAQSILAESGLSLASNQVSYSLLDRKIEHNGLLDYCRREQITLIAYSPLAKGILSGKYTPSNPPPGPRGRQYDQQYLQQLQPLLGLMAEIGQAQGGKTPAQVALNWTICKGSVPIPGAKNASQATANLGSLGWLLTEDEVQALDEASDAFSR